MLAFLNWIFGGRFRKGGEGGGVFTKMRHICAHACDVLVLFMKYASPPKGGGGGGGLGGQEPPWIRSWIDSNNVGE